MKVLIAGCGYVGTRLGGELAKSGHEIWGLRRDALALRQIESAGVKPVCANLLDPDSLKKLPSAEYLIFCQSPSRKNDDYRSTYFQATKNLLDRFRVEEKNASPLRKVIFISSTSVYSTRDGSWVDETTDPTAQNHSDREAQENAKVLLDSEKLVLSSGYPSLVLRLSGIYGEGRNRVLSILEGRVKPVFSDTYMNRIHVADIARMLRLLMERGQPGETYLGSDDMPTTQKEFYSWIFERLSLPLPDANEPDAHPHGQSNKRCSSRKIKALGFKLLYPSFKEGYTPLIAAATAHA